MLSGDYVVAKFKTFASDKFTRFTARAKYKIMMNVFKKEFDIKTYQKEGIVINHFMLHQSDRKFILKSYHEYRYKLFSAMLFGGIHDSMQPLNLIANYYGEKQGMYFTFLMHHTAWLIPPSIVGMILFIYQLYLASVY